jgi:hypothetical protein
LRNLPDQDRWVNITPPKPKRTRKRRMTLARAKRQADEAGLSVSAATYNEDGSLTLMFGKPGNGPCEESNEWDTVQ